MTVCRTWTMQTSVISRRPVEREWIWGIWVNLVQSMQKSNMEGSHGLLHLQMEVRYQTLLMCAGEELKTLTSTALSLPAYCTSHMLCYFFNLALFHWMLLCKWNVSLILWFLIQDGLMDCHFSVFKIGEIEEGLL